MFIACVEIKIWQNNIDVILKNFFVKNKNINKYLLKKEAFSNTLWQKLFSLKIAK